jgi:FMN reductase (NADPH)/FMN reductase [NAD(P)H]
MDFDALFLKRKSVRAYEARPIEDDVKQKIKAAMLRAPTAGALMLYSVLEIEDQTLKERLAETCDHQPFIAKAPWVLIFLADYRRIVDYFEHFGVWPWCERTGRQKVSPRESDLLLACCDALIAAQTASMAAESLGLGSCYIGDIMEHWEVHRELLGLPRYTFPITMLCLGYPTPQQRERALTPRLPEPMVVMKDRYRRLAPEEFASMFQGEGYGKFAPKQDEENPAQALYDRKFSAAFSQEMRRSVASMLKDWQ